MTVEYELTEDDVCAFQYYHNFHSPTARRHYYRSWFIPAAVWLFVCIALWYLGDKDRDAPLRTFLDLLPLFAGVPLYLAYFPWAFRRRVRKIIAGMMREGQNRNLFGRHRVTLSADGITDSAQFSQTSLSWKGVERVVRTGGQVLIYLSAMEAVIVPQRAFVVPSDFEEFLRAARNYHAQAGA